MGVDTGTTVDPAGPHSVTVPGAVAGWAALLERYGRLGLDTCLADAIDAADRGVAVGYVTADSWKQVGGPPELGAPPNPGDIVRLPELARSLRAIAENGPAAMYTGAIASAIASSCWLEEDDLAAYAPAWTEPLSVNYRGVKVFEHQPPTQGVAALEGLGLLQLGQPSLAEQIECVRLALDDARNAVRDGADVSWLLEPGRLRERRRDVAPIISEPAGGTVYICAVDGDGNVVSFIQSLYERFGSGVVAPGTGIVLQNRGACFEIEGAVTPGRRPYHTIIPGMLVGEDMVGAFGVVGGFMQAQAHVQLVSGLVDDHLDPQAALDRPRFRVHDDRVLLEEGRWGDASVVDDLGLEPRLTTETRAQFGCGQAILRRSEGLVGGSDARGDGQAVGF
jgi:gamma-glutamyltranspeptidase/glutathione hydrolase